MMTAGQVGDTKLVGRAGDSNRCCSKTQIQDRIVHGELHLYINICAVGTYKFTMKTTTKKQYVLLNSPDNLSHKHPVTGPKKERKLRLSLCQYLLTLRLEDSALETNN